MRRALFRLFVALVAALAGFAAITWWALESREVVVLRSFDAAGKPRETRVWIAEDPEGVSWIEAANPDRPWLHDVQSHPGIELVRSGATQRWRALPVPGEASHLLVRRLLRAKYGVRDAWVGLLADTRHSVGVRLEAP